MPVRQWEAGEKGMGAMQLIFCCAWKQVWLSMFKGRLHASLPPLTSSRKDVSNSKKRPHHDQKPKRGWAGRKRWQQESIGLGGRASKGSAQVLK